MWEWIMDKFKNYKAVGCPTCQVPAGERCVVTKLPAGMKPGAMHWRDAKKVPYHKARKDAYARTHGKTFVAPVIPTPAVPGRCAQLTPPGNEIVSGTDRLNKLMGR